MKRTELIEKAFKEYCERTPHLQAFLSPEIIRSIYMCGVQDATYIDLKWVEKQEVEDIYHNGTIGYYLNQLPEPYRTQAFENIKLLGEEYRLYYEVNSLKVAVSAAFSWADTPQGGFYWADFKDTL